MEVEIIKQKEEKIRVTIACNQVDERIFRLKRHIFRNCISLVAGICNRRSFSVYLSIFGCGNKKVRICRKTDQLYADIQCI